MAVRNRAARVGSRVKYPVRVDAYVEQEMGDRINELTEAARAAGWAVTRSDMLREILGYGIARAERHWEPHLAEAGIGLSAE